MAETHGEYSFDIVKCAKNLGLVPMGLQMHVPAESRDEWHDTDMVIRRIKTLKRRVGKEALREIGTELVPMLFRLFPAVFQDKKIDSPLKALEEIDSVYHTYNRGTDSGGFDVRTITNSMVIVFDRTPYDCGFTEGILEGAARQFGALHVDAKHISCRNEGDECCSYLVTWTEVEDVGL